MRLRMPQDIFREKGASAVEFAIVLLPLLLVLFGIIEWGLYMYNRQVITNAAREGARYGVLLRQEPRDRSEEKSAIQNRVLAWAAENAGLVTFGSDELTEEDVTVGRPDADPDDEIEFGSDDTDVFSFGSDLKVSVEYTYDFLFLRTLGVGPLKIIGEATMKMEGSEP